MPILISMISKCRRHAISRYHLSNTQSLSSKMDAYTRYYHFDAGDLFSPQYAGCAFDTPEYIATPAIRRQPKTHAVLFDFWAGRAPRVSDCGRPAVEAKHFAFSRYKHIYFIMSWKMLMLSLMIFRWFEEPPIPLGFCRRMFTGMTIDILCIL